MSVTLTKAPAKATASCPAWCNDDHHADTSDYRHHHSGGVAPRHGLYASLSWPEPLTNGGRFLDGGPRIYFSVGDGAMGLSVRQADDLAEIMEELAQDDAVALLRDLVARAGGGR
ncbi:DUF6907 domain-containing protein [Actinomadura decatromicini]|uniref:DUF6907 domain-containing protein n=1 Tax=Actinomadura decatromicini TaxID=2604572 RepID=UPI001652C475|nr:hypothetical protein [Actinomadura decatromicini]